MIFDFIFDTIYGIITVPLSLIPDLGALDPSIQSILDFIIAMVAYGCNFLKYFFTYPLYVAIISATIALLLFEKIYWLVMFIIRKLPFLHIS